MPGNKEDAWRHKGREVVYVRAGGLLRQMAVLGRRARRGAGADVCAAQRRGDPPRPAAPDVEAAGDDRGEARRAGATVRRRARRRCTTWTRRTSTTRSPSSRGMPRRPGRRRRRRRARSWSAAWPRPAPAAAPRETSRSRSPERDTSRRVVSVPRRLHPPHPPGRRRIQPSLPRERADLRRAAGGRAVRAAAADRLHLTWRRHWPGQHPGGRDRPCSTASSRRTSLPPAATPSAPVERLLVRHLREPGQISLYAVPAFVWFSTRLFAGDPHLAERDLRHLRPARPATGISCSPCCTQAARHRAWWSRP